MAPQAGGVTTGAGSTSASGLPSSVDPTASSTAFFNSLVDEGTTTTVSFRVSSTHSSASLSVSSTAVTSLETQYATSTSTSVAAVVTTTIAFGTTATSVIVEVPSGSIFTSLPAASGLPSTGAPNNSNLSSWQAFLVAFFAIVFFFLALRLGIYLLVRKGNATMTSWPHWLQLLCCYRPPEDDEDDSMVEPQFIRQSYLEGGMSYSEASRAQALALVREASVGSWLNRVRGRRCASPSSEDPVPPYPGPPLTPLENPFLDPRPSESVQSSAGAVEGDKEEEDKEAEGPRSGAPGYSR